MSQNKFQFQTLRYKIEEKKESTSVCLQEFREVLSEAMLQNLCDEMYGQLSLPPSSGNPQGIRLGRAKVKRLTIQSSVLVIRAFFRGGLLKPLWHEYMLQLPFCSPINYRPLKELQILARLHEAEVRVPRPVAGFVRNYASGFAYRGLLITEEIRTSENLLVLAKQSKRKTEEADRIQDACYRAGVEARRMIDAGVYHPDLHLGNVLIDRNGKAFLIDFDKALQVRTFNKKYPKSIQQKIEHRWIQSAKKHQLSELTVQPFFDGLAERNH